MYDHQEKLAWARKHFDRLEAEFRVFGNDNPYTSTFDYEKESGEWVARVVVHEALPDHWSLVLGDVLHNMRSALDALVWALVVSTGVEPIKPKSIQFPIFDNPFQFQQHRKACIGQVDLRAQAIIEGLQPDERPHRHGRRQLALLNDLSNVDKHRHLILTGVNGAITNMTLDGYKPVIERYIARKVPIVNGAVIARVKIEGKPRSDVTMHADFGFDVAFADEWPAYGASVSGALNSLFHHVGNDIFPPLEKFL